MSKTGFVSVDTLEGVDENAITSKSVHIKNPGGRPRKEDHERLEKVTIYLTQTEKKDAETKAKGIGVPLSSYLKMRIYGLLKTV
ncbi:MAG: hypothetical protein Q7J27_07505 [Syntrophales bacterium]|nr:hypothetical protein [Syntrophales bacterium]